MSRSLRLFDTEVDVENFNNEFLLLRPEYKAMTGKIGKAIFQEKFSFAEEVIVTEVEICIKLNNEFDDQNLQLLENVAQKKNAAPEAYYLPIYFRDHEDWIAVQSQTGYSKKEIIAQLQTTDFSIAMFGFLPGFVYLDGLTPQLHVPRKKVPAKYVKANSIAIGGKYLGLYALDSPGGWHVIGQTPVQVLEISNIPPVVYNPGDQVRLQAVEEKIYDQLMKDNLSLKEYNARFRNH